MSEALREAEEEAREAARQYVQREQERMATSQLVVDNRPEGWGVEGFLKGVEWERQRADAYRAAVEARAREEADDRLRAMRELLADFLESRPPSMTIPYPPQDYDIWRILRKDASVLLYSVPAAAKSVGLGPMTPDNVEDPHRNNFAPRPAHPQWHP